MLSFQRNASRFPHPAWSIVLLRGDNCSGSTLYARNEVLTFVDVFLNAIIVLFGPDWSISVERCRGILTLTRADAKRSMLPFGPDRKSCRYLGRWHQTTLQMAPTNTRFQPSAEK